MNFESTEKSKLARLRIRPCEHKSSVSEQPRVKAVGLLLKSYL